MSVERLQSMGSGDNKLLKSRPANTKRLRGHDRCGEQTAGLNDDVLNKRGVVAWREVSLVISPQTALNLQVETQRLRCLDKALPSIVTFEPDKQSRSRSMQSPASGAQNSQLAAPLTRQIVHVELA